MIRADCISQPEPPKKEECVAIEKELSLFENRYMQLLVIAICVFLAVVNISLYLRFRETERTMPKLVFGEWETVAKGMQQRDVDPAWRLKRVERLLHHRIDAIFSALPGQDIDRLVHTLPPIRDAGNLWPFASPSGH